jgi:hypothetical protein
LSVLQKDRDVLLEGKVLETLITEQHFNIVERIIRACLIRDYLYLNDGNSGKGHSFLSLTLCTVNQTVLDLLFDKDLITPSAFDISAPFLRLNAMNKPFFIAFARRVSKLAVGNRVLAFVSQTENGYYDIAHILIQNGADINNARDREGRSPLYCACEANALSAVSYLVNLKADVEQSSLLGLTPLHIASKLGHREVVKVLLKAQASVKAVTSTGNTPLHLACQFGRDDCIDLLLAAQADVHSWNNDGKTPFQLLKGSSGKHRRMDEESCKCQ